MADVVFHAVFKSATVMSKRFNQRGLTILAMNFPLGKSTWPGGPVSVLANVGIVTWIAEVLTAPGEFAAGPSCWPTSVHHVHDHRIAGILRDTAAHPLVASCETVCWVMTSPPGKKRLYQCGVDERQTCRTGLLLARESGDQVRTPSKRRPRR